MSDDLCPHGINLDVDGCVLCDAEAQAHHEARRRAQLPHKPAFPRPMSHDEAPSGTTWGDRVEFYKEQDGMTLREHYAGLAMQGLLSDGYRDPTTGRRPPPSATAAIAVAHTDALIAELAK